MATTGRHRGGVATLLELMVSVTYPVSPAATGLGRRPFMTLGTETSHSPDSAHTDWPEAREHSEGWKRRLTVTGAEHFSFTDLPYPAGQPGLSDPAPNLTLSGILEFPRATAWSTGMLG
ncbi:hypothetical protein [Streptomyces sp. NBC_01285]|uniref:hypothetical protein n=1 Tax=Streptomyces sp. NBC_01285 TaxID=2903813 RepID=UPI0022554942|nr:hypothetical protein [Streptomyces sp. NBC_01285]MCX4769117.1 hypothetical protein [Streptomyces sp. NBC_01285]